MPLPLPHPFAVVLAVAPAAVQEPVPQVRQLPGGASLLLVEDPSLDLAHGELRFRAGPWFEPPGKEGLVSVLAGALAEGGSLREGGAALGAWLEEEGAALGVRAGAGELALVFSAPPAALGGTMGRLRDLLLAPAYPPTAVERGRQHALAELWARADDPAATADRALLRLAYGDEAPAARAPPEGTLRALERDDLLAFHRAHLGPNRLWIAVAAPLQAEAIAELAAELVRDLPAVPEAPRIAHPPFQPQEGARVWLIDRPDIERVELRAAASGIPRSHADSAALDLWNGVVEARAIARAREGGGSLGAQFRMPWSRPGELHGFAVSDEGGAAAALSTLVELARADSQAPITLAELEAARRRAEGIGPAGARTPAEMLERLLDPHFHGEPPDAWERWRSGLAELSAGEVLAAAASHLPADPSGLLLVAVGPARTLKEGLEPLGPVVLSSPQAQPKGTPGGLALRERLFEALGGPAPWARLSSVLVRGEVDVPGLAARVEVAIWRDLRGRRLRLEQTTEGRRRIHVVTPGGGWTKSEQGFSDLPPELVASYRRREERQLFQLLHDLASDLDLSVDADGEGNLVVHGPSEVLAWIELGADGLPARLGYPAVDPGKGGGAGEPGGLFTFSDWTDAGAWRYPARAEQPEAGITYRWTSFVPNPELDEELFRRPMK